MKKLLLHLLFVATAYSSAAQAPTGIPFQAVARSSSGGLIANHTLSIRVSIHDSTADGTVLYQETFAPTTNNLGLFDLMVGTGSVTMGALNSVAWGHNAKYMQVEMDPSGGTSYTTFTTQKLGSVPYALYANNGMPTGANPGDMLYWDGSIWRPIAAGTDGQVLTLAGGRPVWATNAAFLSVGKYYGGGVIAYLLQSGDSGYDPLVPHGIIAHPTDLTGTFAWGCSTSSVATGSQIGNGQSNTLAVSIACDSNSAAFICHTTILNGFSDWYLPSLDELFKLYFNRTAIGGFTTDSYWSSTQYDGYSSNCCAWKLTFSTTAGAGADSKGSHLRVRPIRSF
jgi:hypothetical protein